MAPLREQTSVLEDGERRGLCSDRSRDRQGQPGAAHWWNEHWVAPIGGGGGTPLALGVRSAGNVLARAARSKPAQQRWLWLLTDGRTPDTPSRPFDADCVVIVDFENDAVRLGRCASLARAWDAQYSTSAQLAYSHQRGV